MAIVERKIKRKDRKPSTYIYVEISLPNGKKLKRSMGKKGLITKTQARIYEQELKRKVKLGQLDMVKQYMPTFNEFIPDFVSCSRDVKQNRCWQIAEHCVKDFGKYFGEKKL